MTRLGDTTAKAGPAKAASRFMQALQGRRVQKPITIPGLGLTGVMVLVGSARLLDIEGEVIEAMANRHLEQTVLTLGNYELERAIRTLAEAVRDDDPTKASEPPPLGTVEEWGALAPETIGHLYAEFGELREEHDPAAADLTGDEWEAIVDAIAKKNSTLLRSFGVRRLARYLTTTVAQPASSPIPKSEPGDTSPES